MATIHIRDIMEWLTSSGYADNQPWSGEFFLEIRFDEPASLARCDAGWQEKSLQLTPRKAQ